MHPRGSAGVNVSRGAFAVAAAVAFLVSATPALGESTLHAGTGWHFYVLDVGENAYVEGTIFRTSATGSVALGAKLIDEHGRGRATALGFAGRTDANAYAEIGGGMDRDPFLAFAYGDEENRFGVGVGVFLDNVRRGPEFAITGRIAILLYAGGAVEGNRVELELVRDAQLVHEAHGTDVVFALPRDFQGLVTAGFAAATANVQAGTLSQRPLDVRGVFVGDFGHPSHSTPALLWYDDGLPGDCPCSFGQWGPVLGQGPHVFHRAGAQGGVLSSSESPLLFGVDLPLVDWHQLVGDIPR